MVSPEFFKQFTPNPALDFFLSYGYMQLYPLAWVAKLLQKVA